MQLISSVLRMLRRWHRTDAKLWKGHYAGNVIYTSSASACPAGWHRKRTRLPVQHWQALICSPVVLSCWHMRQQQRVSPPPPPPPPPSCMPQPIRMEFQLPVQLLEAISAVMLSSGNWQLQQVMEGDEGSLPIQTLSGRTNTVVEG